MSKEQPTPEASKHLELQGHLTRLHGYFYRIVGEEIDKRTYTLKRWFWAMVDMLMEVRKKNEELELEMRTMKKEIKELRALKKKVKELESGKKKVEK